jgi:hypothetical protein
MSVIFLDGFDYYNGFGPGGRKWDAGSSGSFAGGRFGGQCLITGNQRTRGMGTQITFKNLDNTIRNVDTIVLGFAMVIGGYSGAWGDPEMPSNPLLTFMDLGTPQCSLWIDPTTQFLKILLGDGYGSPTVVLTTAFVPPLTLWFYLEIKLTVGTTGSIELLVDGTSIGSASGVNLQQSGNSYCNQIAFYSFNNYSGGVQPGAWAVDDLYVVDTTDGSGSVDYLGEVRIQTKVPDANGSEINFLRSTGLVNSNNVNILPMGFYENGYFNYSGTVGENDLYSIANFTVSGTIFAVQENISYKKDDVGNRQVAPILKTAAIKYIGNYVAGTEPHTLWHSCYSSYTYASQIWEINPSTSAPWELLDLNLAEFGVKVVS